MGTVHVIDDDSAVRDVIGILCRSISTPYAEYPSIEAFDQSEGRTQAGCILLDLRLPRLGGLPGVQHICSSYPNHPVIVMSAYATTRTVALSMKAGAVDFFDKPFVSQDLLDSIQQALATSRDAETPPELKIRLELLSSTQRRVMSVLAHGASDDEAAVALSLHKKSIQRHRRSALEKLMLSPGEETKLLGLLDGPSVQGVS
ncbi:MAG TPA: response regulator [Devosia sp.]|uniref:response regulator transcription factor n=1 Tax=Devosia sp. TaxID=1871048 RepID=UPI002F940E57